MRYQAWLVLMTVLLAGCATLFTGTRDNVTINSEPPGATILLDGFEQGRTPATISIKRAGLSDKQVTLQLDGYEDRTFTLQEEFNTVAILNLFFFPGWVVDVVTGSITRYDPRNLTLELQRSGRTFNMRDLPQGPGGSYEVPPGDGAAIITDYPTGWVVVVK